MSTQEYDDYWFHYVLEENPEEIKERVEELYITIDEKKIHLDVYPNKTAGEKTLIFIHGTAVYSRFYAEFCYKLNQLGYRIIAPDLIGHGKSEGIRGHFTMEDLTKVISGVVSYTINSYGEDVVIVGSSLGGITALYSIAYDERIKGAICHNAAIFNEDAHERIVKVRGILRILKPLVPSMAKIFPKLKLSVWNYLDMEKLAQSMELKKRIEILLEDPMLSDKYTLTSLRAQMKEPLKKPVEKIAQPIMIINGDNDVLFSVDYVTEIYQRLSSTEKKLVILDDTSHLIFQENIDLALDHIIPWLKNLF
ncbi:MAG: hypothetical protein BAJALOKI2v1_70050 [Promethearchaeota archaeon]|nr:MAG: hypothetical protein BAJALOKI2v1_70050 [Candidatus Lokiarchaeota archaeon]